METDSKTPMQAEPVCYQYEDGVATLIVSITEGPELGRVVRIPFYPANVEFLQRLADALRKVEL